MRFLLTTVGNILVLWEGEGGGDILRTVGVVQCQWHKDIMINVGVLNIPTVILKLSSHGIDDNPQGTKHPSQYL